MLLKKYDGIYGNMQYQKGSDYKLDIYVQTELWREISNAYKRMINMGFSNCQITKYEALSRRADC